MKAKRIGFLIKGDGMFFTGFTVADDDARKTGKTLQPDQMFFKRYMGKDQSARLIGNDFFPVFLAGC